MDADLRAELADGADQRARLHPAQLDAAVRSGTRRLAARLLLAQAVAVVVTALLIGGFGLYSIAGADAPTLALVELAPATTSVSVGDSASLVATGRYADGSTDDLTDSVEWSSDDSGVAKVADGGVVDAVGPGTVVITADKDGVTGMARITVQPADAELISLALTPQRDTLTPNETLELTATGTYDDGTSVDLTDAASWTTSNEDVAASDAGLVTASAPGTTTITATVEGTSGTARITVEHQVAQLTSLEIAPDEQTLALGDTVQLAVTGTYADGSSRDLTEAVVWTTSDGAVADVSPSGLVSASGPGSASIAAGADGITDTARITVEPEAAELTSLEIVPGEHTLALGESVELTVTGTYADGSSRDLSDTVAWTTGNQAVAGVSDTGVVTADGVGVATITATEAGRSDTARLTVEPVTPVLTSLSVDPGKSSLDPGENAPFTATGTYADGSTADLTSAVAWTTDDERVATVTEDGDVTAVGPGTTILRAALDGIGDTAVVGVTRPVTVTGVLLSKSDVVRLCPGHTIQLRAFATYSNGIRRDVTRSAGWSTDDGTVATVSAGLVTFTGPYGAATDVSVGIGSSSDSVRVSCPTVD